MEKDKLIQRLMETFLGEAEEHVRALNHDLLALEKGGPTADLLKELFRTAHSLKGAARSVGIAPIEAICHGLEETLAAARDGRLTIDPARLQGLLDSADSLGARVRELRATRDAASPPAPATEPPRPAASDLRVASHKLDALLARAGELAVARRRLDPRVEEVRSARDPRALDRVAEAIRADLRALDQAAAPLEEEVRRLRMLPFSEACEGLDRLARDLAKEEGKEVDLVVSGAGVELDRSVLEGLKDPLLHLVRNAVSHGIEPPERRRAAGKDAHGRVTVSAALKGPRVEVSVEDDGGGIDVAAVRERAEKTMTPLPSDSRRLIDVIFRAGFTTARSVTAASGRGVGLDVVKSRVEAMQGWVEVSFQPGRGARFLLDVPLTLATLRALLVEAAGQPFALLSSSVQRMIRAGAEDFRPVEGRETVLLGEAPVLAVRLSEALGLATAEPPSVEGRVPVIVVSAGRDSAALVVDRVLEEREVSVRGLGARVRRVRGVSGATVLPSGRVALILSTAEVVEAALARASGASISEALARRPAEAKKRLLVVDDSVTTRTLIASLLSAEGFEVRAASDGTEAWDLLQREGADLVVADIEMPRMDGFALTQSVRASKRLRDLPVILVTAMESESDKARGMEAGADAYLLKSAFDQRQLLECIRQLL